MLPSFCRDVVTVRRAPLVMANGRTERDWAHAQPHQIAGASVQQGATSTNYADAGAPARIAATLYAPPNADVQEGDRVTFGGKTYVVDGIPEFHPEGATGNLAHTVAYLRAWGG